MKEFPYYQSVEVTDILKAREYICEVGTTHTFKEKDAYFLVYIEKGHMILEAQGVSYPLSQNQLHIAKADKDIHFYAVGETAEILGISFRHETEQLLPITTSTYTMEGYSEELLLSMTNEIKKINFLKKRKPSMAYDKQIGEFFTVSCALLHAFLTQILLLLLERTVRDHLPDFLTKDHPFFSPARESWDTLNNQVVPINNVHFKKQSNKLVEQIIDYMNNNLDKNYSIDDIAQEFLVGSSNLKKIFKRETNSSIITYYKTLKMQAAKQWIKENELSYTEISDRLGFSSLHHFSAAFKKFTGLSPSKYFQSQQPDYTDNRNNIDVIINQRPWST